MGVGALAAEPRDGALAEAGGRLDESIYIGLETLTVVVIGNDRVMLCAGGVHRDGKRQMQHKVAICAGTFSLVARSACLEMCFCQGS